MDDHVAFDVVRQIATALPDVEESTTYRAPSFKVRGKVFACQPVHRSAEPDSLAVWIGVDQRAELIRADPGVYYLTEHYVDHPIVLVRISRIHRDSLRDLLGMAWHFVSEKKKRTRKQATID